jgi:hypothetical protein
MMKYPTYPLPITSCDGIEGVKVPMHIPASVPVIDAIRNGSHRLAERAADRPVKSTTIAIESQNGISRPGSGQIGHQQSAAPIKVRAAKSTSLRIDPPQFQDGSASFTIQGPLVVPLRL